MNGSSLAEANRAESLWTLSEGTDPISDEPFHEASATFSKNDVSTKVNVKCIGRNLSYTFVTESEWGLRLPVKQPVATSSTVIQMRFDDAPPRNFLAATDGFGNIVTVDNSPSAPMAGFQQLGILASTGYTVADSNDLAKVGRLRIRLSLIESEITLDIDQSDPNLAKVVEMCQGSSSASDIGSDAPDNAGIAADNGLNPQSRYDAFPSEVRDLIQKADLEDDDCRGASGDDPNTTQACARRDSISTELGQLGWCWSGGKIEAEAHWLRCSDPEYQSERQQSAIATDAMTESNGVAQTGN